MGVTTAAPITTVEGMVVIVEMTVAESMNVADLDHQDGTTKEVTFEIPQLQFD